MKNLISIFRGVIIILFLFINVHVNGQSYTDNPKEDKVVKKYNHVIYGNGAGIFVPMAIVAYSGSINYEFFLSPKKPNAGLRIGMGMGVGYSELYGLYDEELGNFINPKLILLTGKRNSHFELSGGVFIKFLQYQISANDFVSEEKALPSLTIGYRYQKPKGGFMFRTGFSLPETLYVGFGYSF